MTTRNHIGRQGLHRPLAIALTLAAVAASALVADSAAHTTSCSSGCNGPYSWPVRPFDEQHPIRGNFGDPRTVFRGKRSRRTIASGPGTFSFHHGVDISAPDGAPVYAVADGRVIRAHGGRVTVRCGNGRSFEYWHIKPVVRVGEQATAGKTMLGRILPTREHVHLTQRENGRPVNPLVPGRLTPYRDETRPTIFAVTLRDGGSGRRLSGMGLSGKIELRAEARDAPALAVPGAWHDLPVTPAELSWRIETTGGRMVIGEHTPWDVRHSLPTMRSFWQRYARGTRQNRPVFNGHRAFGMTGRYVFDLTPHGLDTTKLAPGSYVLILTARDTAGNSTTSRLELRVLR